MRIIMNNNQIKAKDIEIKAEGTIDEIAVVRDVRISYKLNNEGKRTEKIDSVRYDCINPATFSSFTIKVPSANPIVTKEEIEVSQNAVYVKIPVDNVVIRPYAIEYGIAKVTITAPYVNLVEE